MKAIYYILSVVMLTLAACSDSIDEPAPLKFKDGEIPLSINALAPTSRADIEALDGTKYDVYTCGVLNSAKMKYFYTKNDKQLFFKMLYGAVIDDYGVEYKLFYIPDAFYPITSTSRPMYMTLLSYGVEKGGNLKATVSPDVLTTDRPYAEHMVLDLTDNDGTFDVIAADRMYVLCSKDLDYHDLPYGHFHHIFARLNFKVKWASEVPYTASIIDKVEINSITIDNTPCRGKLHVGKTVDIYDTLPITPIPYDPDAEHDYLSYWDELGSPVTLENRAVTKRIPYSSGIDFGGSYIVPQTNRQRIIVNYTITQASAKRTMNYVICDDTTQSWLPGHKYTYTINIGEAGNITIDKVKVEVTGFSNVNDIEEI